MSMHTHRHNDLPFVIRLYYENQFNELNLTVNGSAHPPGPSWQTDIPRLRAGKVGGQVIGFFNISTFIMLA